VRHVLARDWYYTTYQKTKYVPYTRSRRLKLGHVEKKQSMRCGLAPGHIGRHYEEWGSPGEEKRVEWVRDEREDDDAIDAKGNSDD
jgi:hypothetical protein